MKLKIFVIAFVSFLNLDLEAQDITGPNHQADGKPDIIWRRKSVPDSWAWQMDQLTVTDAIFLGWSSDANWKIVGAGDFNGDTKLDLLWRHETQDLIGIWYMNGPVWFDAAMVNYFPGNSWRIVGVGDFGSAPNGTATSVQDGKPDIVWQNRDTGDKALWLMENTVLKGTNFLDSSTPDWKIVTVADFGKSGSDSSVDGRKPDLVLANYNTGQVAIRFMDGLSQIETVNLFNVQPPPGSEFTFSGDEDKQIVNAGDFILDGKQDLLVRHATDGRQFVWQLGGKNVLQEWALPPHQWDVDWRIAGQDLNDSTWRLTRSITPLLSTVATPTQVSFNLIDYPALGVGETFTVERAPAGSANFTTIQSGVTALSPDTGVSPTNEYDYHVYKRTQIQPLTGPLVTARAAVAPPILCTTAAGSY